MKKYFGYLRPREVAQYLNIPLDEVEKMIKGGELPSTTIAGEVRVPWDQLETWLDEEVSEQELSKLSQHVKNVSEQDVKHFVKSQKPAKGKAKAAQPKTKKKR
ncbi:MAG TPA: excisionase family DNA-binding protein [Candidatus Bipolaricaulota bacterium]